MNPASFWLHETTDLNPLGWKCHTVPPHKASAVGLFVMETCSFSFPNWVMVFLQGASSVEPLWEHTNANWCKWCPCKLATRPPFVLKGQRSGCGCVLVFISVVLRLHMHSILSTPASLHDDYHILGCSSLKLKSIFWSLPPQKPRYSLIIFSVTALFDSRREGVHCEGKWVAAKFVLYCEAHRSKSGFHPLKTTQCSTSSYG